MKPMFWNTHWRCFGDMQGLTSYTRASKRAGAVSFTLDGIHPHDIATILDREGVAIRAGNHCTQPLMQSMGVNATARASFAMYNTKDEVDQLVNAIKKPTTSFRNVGRSCRPLSGYYSRP